MENSTWVNIILELAEEAGNKNNKEESQNDN